MQIFAGLTREQARKQRAQLTKEIAREQRKRDRENLAELRRQIADVKLRRREAMRLTVERCRTERQLIKDRTRQMREQARAAVNAEADKAKCAARQACAARRAEVRDQSTSALEKLEAERQAERTLQRQLAHAEHRRRKDTRTAAERRQESDDEVLRNLPDDLVELWHKVKKQIRATDRMSRTEAFLAYVENHPEELVETMQELSDRELKKLLREERRLQKARPRRDRATAEELAAVPF